MASPIQQGRVSFVNHEKKTVMIEYEANGKKKAINGPVDNEAQLLLKKKGVIKKAHEFHIGDVVNFTAGISARGNKMVASNIRFLYNTALDILVTKAKTENRFLGYLKIADDKYFVKEIDSYLFFPVSISPWQVRPAEDKLNEPVTFMLENMEKKDKITAKLFDNTYIPEFHTALKLHKSQTPVEAVVYKVSPHGIYVNVVGENIQAKLPFNEGVKAGDIISVKIVYLSPAKIIVEAL